MWTKIVQIIKCLVFQEEINHIQYTNMNDTYDPEKRFNERAQVYDNEIETMIPGYKTMHELSHHILKSSLPKDAFVLIGGSGTGNEAIEYLSENPGWNIVGFDIAEEMIKKANSKILQNGIQDRIELVHGGISDVTEEGFDAATLLLVLHFIPKEDKEDFLTEIYNRLKPGGRLIIADICDDSNENRFEDFLSVWSSLQLQTRNQKDVQEMLKNVRENLNKITIEQTITLLEKVGFTNIHHFSKSLLINGFVMEKNIQKDP